MIDSNLETIKRAAEELDQVLGQDDNMAEWAQEKLAVVKSMLVAVKDYVVSQKSTGIDPQVDEEFDMIESVIESLAVRNQVDAEVIWEDLESLTEDELYVFAVTTPVMEDWQKVNKKDKTDGMSKKAVASYRRENPGSKLKTAVTTKPSKLKKGSKASKRRKSYCSRSKGQMNMHNISCAKTPDKAICKARRRWNC
jgi:DNA-binding transcriptional regulator YdaS (Cro superfamily)